MCMHTAGSAPRASKQASKQNPKEREREKEDAPLHVPPLGATQRHDPLLGQHVQRKRIDPLLIDDDKVFRFPNRVALRVELLVADEFLQLDDLAHFGVGELAFGFDELFALLGGRVEEPRVDLAVCVCAGEQPQYAKTRGSFGKKSQPRDGWGAQHGQKTHVFSYSSETLRVRM